MMDLKYEHLLGKVFDHGTVDCYSLQRDFWADNFSIDLPDYARPDDWWDQGLDLYRENFAANGFEVVDIPITEMQPADVILMAIRASVPNHSSVHLGGGQMLHHFIGRLSEKTEYSGFYRNRTSAILRHKSLMDWTPEYEQHPLGNPPSPL